MVGADVQRRVSLPDVPLEELPLVEPELLGVVLPEPLAPMLPELDELDGVVVEPDVVDVSVLLGVVVVSVLLRVERPQPVEPKPSASAINVAAAVSESFCLFIIGFPPRLD